MRHVGREVATPPSSDDAVCPVVAALLADLERLNDERSRKLVLPFLPTDQDGEPSRALGALIASEALALHAPFIDLVAEFRGVPSSEAPRLFNHNICSHHWSDVTRQKFAATPATRRDRLGMDTSTPYLGDELSLRRLAWHPGEAGPPP
jgi:hypothetical protein